jgi:DinB superfamily
MMTQNLTQNHQIFTDYVLSLNEQEYEYAAAGKWSAGQQLDHIVKSVSPVTLAFRLPKFVLGWVFGKANRPSRSYDELVVKYKSKLAEGGVAPGRFVPKNQVFADRKNVVEKLSETVKTLCEKVANCSESDLESYVIPHPLLGKLTLREMLYFTTYHVQHHQELIKKYLTKNEKI